MQLKPDFDLQLLIDKYGFMSTRDNKELLNDDDLEWMMNEDYYILFIDGGRRGQMYFLFVTQNRILAINSTRPDGVGCEAPLPSILFKMMQDGVFEEV